MHRSLLALVLLAGCSAMVEAPSNLPPRILFGQGQPDQRESTIRVGPSCPSPRFAVFVDDPDAADTIRAQWFIDPNDRYVAALPDRPAFPASPGTPIEGSTVRVVEGPRALVDGLARFNDGRKHRVEVVVTDGEFIEGQRTDSNGNSVPFLDTTRPAVRTPKGEVVPIEAFRDGDVWFVDVDATPCQ